MTILLSDDFSGDGQINQNKWHFNKYKDDGSDGSFYGRTQQRQELAKQSNGAMHLKLETYNPTGNPNDPTFFGSETISDRLFSLKDGPIAFEARVRYAQPQAGIMGEILHLCRSAEYSRRDRFRTGLDQSRISCPNQHLSRRAAQPR